MKGEDTISRRAVIDVIHQISFEHYLELSEYAGEHKIKMRLVNAGRAIDKIGDLPSIKPKQPDYHTDHGYMWLCPKCGQVIHSDYTKCFKCGYRRQGNRQDQ